MLVVFAGVRAPRGWWCGGSSGMVCRSPQPPPWWSTSSEKGSCASFLCIFLSSAPKHPLLVGVTSFGSPGNLRAPVLSVTHSPSCGVMRTTAKPVPLHQATVPSNQQAKPPHVQNLWEIGTSPHVYETLELQLSQDTPQALLKIIAEQVVLSSAGTVSAPQRVQAWQLNQ